MRRCWFLIFPFLGSCPIASRHGQWPDPWAGVTECCSLLAGHREITGGGKASIEGGRSGGYQFRIVEPQCGPALQIRRPATFIIPIGAAIPPSCPSPRPQSPHLTQKRVVASR